MRAASYVAGSHELSPQINYLLHNKLLAAAAAAGSSRHNSSGTAASGSSPPNPAAGSTSTRGHPSSSGASTASDQSSATSGDDEWPPAHNNNNNHLLQAPLSQPAAAATAATNAKQRRQSVASQAGWSSSSASSRSRSYSQPPAPQPAPTPKAPSKQECRQQQPPLDPRDAAGLPAPLPPIRNSCPAAAHVNPLTVHEYECRLRLGATDEQLVERVFRGGLASNRLRAALWPNLFNLVHQRGHFKPLCDGPLRQLPDSEWEYVEHPANEQRWLQLKELYYSYEAQWKCITRDQEQRFSSFRERKSLIERDVVRSDRSHPFYSTSDTSTNHLNAFTHLLMTYMMYDFDIGYMQGMSDLAAPILYVFQGDLIKSFWVFVEVMKLLRRNFEPSQKTIHFQLNCLYRLLQTTDPVFAQYLEQQEASNCFFVFRAIMCQFKRELMKNDEDDYSNVLALWDTIWCVGRMSAAAAASPEDDHQHHQNPSQPLDHHSASTPIDPLSSSSAASSSSSTSASPSPTPTHTTPTTAAAATTASDSNQADLNRHSLTDTELFVLALCLSMIRRERDLVLARRLDATEIHLHFIDPYLTKDLNGFIEQANQIYSYLKNDFDHSKFHQLNHHHHPLAPTSNAASSKPLPIVAGISKHQHQQLAQQNNNYESPYGSAGSYDLLSDFLIINGASGL